MNLPLSTAFTESHRFWVDLFSFHLFLCILWFLSWFLLWLVGYSGACCLASIEFSSVAQSCSTLWPHESQHARPPCPSPTSGVYSNWCALNRWCHPAISFSVIPFSSCPQPLPASGSFPMNQLFAWGGQSTGVSAFSISPSNEYPGTDLLQNGLVGSPCSPRDSQESSPTPQFKSINFLVLSFLHSPTLTFICLYF